MRDYRTTEVRELKDNLVAARTELSMQGALIIALTRKVTHLERHAEELEKNHSKAIDDIQREHDSEVRSIALARSSNTSTDQQTLLLRRALAAERELARLRSSTQHTAAGGEKDGDTAGKGLQEELQRERERNGKLQDQVRQLNQDLAAVEQLRISVDTSTGAAAEVQRNRDGTALMVSPNPRLERALGIRCPCIATPAIYGTSYQVQHFQMKRGVHTERPRNR
jgi:DNA repair exonuclease SbcCD ATPase subunit